MKNVLKIIAGLLFLALFAQLTITLPLNEAGIPITGQSFAVLLMAIFYGKRDALLVVLIYLIMGGLGLPVFADGASGWEKFSGGSGGFLAGFAVAAWLVGLFGDQGWGRSFVKSLLAMTVGTIIIVAMGVLWLTKLYGFEKALEYGFYPFIWGALIKIVVGALIPPIYYKLIGK